MASAAKQQNDAIQPMESAEQWDHQGWKAESIPFRTAAKLATTLSVRFDPESASLLRRAARMECLTKSEFVRRSTNAAARGVLERALPPAASITSLHKPSQTTRSASGKRFRPVATPISRKADQEASRDKFSIEASV